MCYFSYRFLGEGSATLGQSAYRSKPQASLESPAQACLTPSGFLKQDPEVFVYLPLGICM